MVCLEWPDIMWKWGKLTSLSVFKTPFITAYQRYAFVLTCIPSVCVCVFPYVGVLVCEKSMYVSRSSSGSWWPARQDCVRFFNNVCRAFQQKHLINRLWRSANPSVSDHHACAAGVCVFVCVSLWFFGELDACRMVGTHNHQLNYPCHKTTDPRPAPLPASQWVGQPPNTGLPILLSLSLSFPSVSCSSSP